MTERTDPLVITLHGSLLELTLRVARIERELQLHEPFALATFGQGPRDALAPTPDYTTADACSCDEALMLRARVRDLESQLTRLGTAR